MDYPVFSVPFLGASMLIAVVAIVHVYIAHFAVGAGIFNAITETWALKKDSQALRRFLKDNSHFIILLPFIGGAVTGVGIWFTIALSSPETVSALIHFFVWGWAIEWTFFVVEIISGYVYYYGWDRMSKKAHCFVGWLYAISAFLSLVVINGILTFMLTPGNALDSTVSPMQFDFWAGVFNPSYWPQLIIRSIGALSLAAMFSMMLVNVGKRYSQDEKDEVTVYAGKYFIPFILLLPAGLWFYLVCPAMAQHYLQGGSVIMLMFFTMCAGAISLIGVYGYWAVVINKKPVSLEMSVLLLLLAVGAAGGGEFVREGIRKPYLIYNHIYSNGFRVADVPAIQEKCDKREIDTILRMSPWCVQPNDTGMTDEEFYALDIGDMGKDLRDYKTKIIKGSWVYDQQCLRCHSLDGYNSMKALTKGWSKEAISEVTTKLDEIKMFMPPFVGTLRDRDCLNFYVHSLNGACSECHVNLDDDGKVIDESISYKDDGKLRDDYVPFGREVLK